MKNGYVLRKAYIEIATDLSEQGFEDWLKKAIYLNEETKDTNKYEIIKDSMEIGCTDCLLDPANDWAEKKK